MMWSNCCVFFLFHSCHFEVKVSLTVIVCLTPHLAGEVLTAFHHLQCHMYLTCCNCQPKTSGSYISWLDCM